MEDLKKYNIELIINGEHQGKHERTAEELTKIIALFNHNKDDFDRIYLIQDLLRDFIDNFIEYKDGEKWAEIIETLQSTYDIIDDIDGIKEKEKERQEKIFYVTNLYDEYITQENKQKGETGGISWGEVAYIENLDIEELDKLEDELLKELEALQDEK